MIRTCHVVAAVLLLAAAVRPAAAQQTYSAARATTQPAEWFRTPAAARMADDIVSYQFDNGGWPKNIDTSARPATRPMVEPGPEVPEEDVPPVGVNPGLMPHTLRPTFDNDATTTELRFLGRICAATGDPKYLASFYKGLDYTLAAQYANGGWPQCVPPHPAYARRITFNDGAMARIMFLLKDAGASPDFAFVDPGRRSACRAAFDRGVDCILKCQVRVDGKLTAWCQQHDEVDFSPAWARTFEPPALTANESVGVCHVLMSIDRPSPAVVAAVDAAVAWMRAVEIHGVRVVDTRDPAAVHKIDRAVVKDPDAPTIWARYYEIGTDRPIYCGRDSVIKYDLADVEIERRTGYQWLKAWPKNLVDNEYDAWKARVAGQGDKVTR